MTLACGTQVTVDSASQTYQGSIGTVTGTAYLYMDTCSSPNQIWTHCSITGTSGYWVELDTCRLYLSNGGITWTGCNYPTSPCVQNYVPVSGDTGKQNPGCGGPFWAAYMNFQVYDGGSNSWSSQITSSTNYHGFVC